MLLPLCALSVHCLSLVANLLFYISCLFKDLYCMVLKMETKEPMLLKTNFVSTLEHIKTTTIVPLTSLSKGLSRSVNTKKAVGPGDVSGQVLKLKAFQPVTGLVCHSLTKSTILPVPKKTKPTCLTDSHPMVLTSNHLYCFLFSDIGRYLLYSSVVTCCYIDKLRFHRDKIISLDKQV